MREDRAQKALACAQGHLSVAEALGLPGWPTSLKNTYGCKAQHSMGNRKLQSSTRGPWMRGSGYCVIHCSSSAIHVLPKQGCASVQPWIHHTPHPLIPSSSACTQFNDCPVTDPRGFHLHPHLARGCARGLWKRFRDVPAADVCVCA